MVNRLRRLRAIRASRSRGIVSSLRLNYPELAEGPANFHEPSRDLALSDCLRHCLDEDMYECSVERLSLGVILYDIGCRRGEKGGQRQTTFLGGDFYAKSTSGKERPGGPTLWSGNSDRPICDDSPVHQAAVRLICSLE